MGCCRVYWVKSNPLSIRLPIPRPSPGAGLLRVQGHRARGPESQHPSYRLHVLGPLSLRQSEPARGLLSRCSCKEPTCPPGWAPCPCPVQPCKHSGTLHLTSFPRVCLVSACPSPAASSYLALSAGGTEGVCLCVGFLTFSSRSSIVPTSPATSPSCPPPPFLTPSSFDLVLSRRRCCCYCCCSSPLAVLVVRQDNLDTSFISSPCTIEFAFCFENPSPGKLPRYPPTYPQGQPPKKHRHFVPSRIIPAQLSPPATTKPFDCVRPGLS